ncbi:MAG: GNAT family N-acetyltransferase [Actinobacteria bacterium]|nr:MAG: GNAT family N-acetyltransferase [Actinomycetota bacterium]
MTTPRELNIGPAREQELGAVLDLWEIARSSYSSTPDNPEVLARLIDRDTGALLVARRGGRVVGTLIAAWDGWRGNMYRLAVVPEHRRAGIGLALVQAGEQLRLSEGYFSCPNVHSRGSLSSRHLSSFAPCRIRPELTWSKLTSMTSSGLSDTHSSSRSAAHRLGSADPRSPVS